VATIHILCISYKPWVISLHVVMINYTLYINLMIWSWYFKSQFFSIFLSKKFFSVHEKWLVIFVHYVFITYILCMSIEESWKNILVAKMGEMSKTQLGVIGALFLSVASSVSIVICNKALMSNLGFPFGNYHVCYLLNIIIYILSKKIL